MLPCTQPRQCILSPPDSVTHSRSIAPNQPTRAQHTRCELFRATPPRLLVFLNMFWPNRTRTSVAARIFPTPLPKVVSAPHSCTIGNAQRPRAKVSRVFSERVPKGCVFFVLVRGLGAVSLCMSPVSESIRTAPIRGVSGVRSGERGAGRVECRVWSVAYRDCIGCRG